MKVQEVETFIKYASWVLVIVVAVHGSLSAFFGDSPKFVWLKLVISRCVFCCASIIAALLTILSSCLEDKASAASEKKLNNKLNNSEEALKKANWKIDDANKKLDESLKANEKLWGLVVDQSKSIGSLVYNMETSLQGKRRFIENFETLSLLSKFDNRLLEYHCQICDDGVAVFWFERSSAELKGFYFFSNAEINSVLSANPLDDNFISDDGEVVVDRNKELFTVYSKWLLKKVPDKSQSAVVQIKISGMIDVMIKEILYYAYRAIPGTADVKSYEYKDRPLLSGDKRVSFSYYVNPLADSPVIRSVSVDLNKDFLDGLFGLARKDFSERIVEKFRQLRLEAKVTPEIVRHLSSHAVKTISGAGKERSMPVHADIRPEVNSNAGNVVGYVNDVIKKGVNRLEISFKAIEVYPTLDKILNFNPANALIGDVISFYLDGKFQNYRVDSWDEDKGAYVLTCNEKYGPKTTSLSSVPYIKNIWITHNNAQPISVCRSGVVAGKYLKHVKSWEVSQYEGTEAPGGITVRLVEMPGESR